MSIRSALFALAIGAALPGAAEAADVFLSNGSVFSGVANEHGEGLILPQTLIAGADFGLQTRIESPVVGEFAIVATMDDGHFSSGLSSFPIAPTAEFDVQARVMGEDIAWGLRPYVGVGVNSSPAHNRVFQGIAQLLPYETESMGVHGVAGIAYELMPGIGAGLEYRYQTNTSEAPVLAGPGENQSIMMRLDLGLN